MMTWGKVVVAGLLAGIGYALGERIVDAAIKKFSRGPV